VTQLVQDPAEAGREALRRHAWDEGYRLLREADAAGDLAPADLELLAEAAMFNGHADQTGDYLERAYRGHLDAGNRLRAAYVATWVAHELKNALQTSVARGWMSRAKRLLDEEPEAPEHGYWALQQALFLLGEHDYDEAYALSKRAEELGRRFGDRNLEIRGLQRRGSALIEKGEVAEGKVLLDEASAAALGGELDPYSTITVYCNTIGACRDVADFESAGQWTDRASAFCDSHSVAAFPGMCRVNYAEVMRYKGKFAEAEELAGRAGEELRAWCPRLAGAAFYELGETRLRLGELAQAEQAFREADEYGREPEPGLSLLRLAQGNAKAAFSSIRRALVEDGLGVPARARLLPPAVHIAVEAGELDAADAWAEELAGAAETVATSALQASAAFARGSVALARGESGSAIRELKQARMLWDANGAGYDTARARELLGRAYRVEGDEDAATWQLEAAAVRFERLGAARDGERVAGLLAGRDVTRAVMKTFLFTDIVGSTELASRLEDRHWMNVLRRHDETLRTVFGDWGGSVVDHTGDGFFAAFEDPAGAAQAAIAIHRVIDQEFEFDLRIGIHTDGALETGQSYHGKGVHAAARIGAAAAAQEILASRATMEDLPQFPVRDLRAVRLKGFSEPVEVCSVEWRSA
jgi:class 3 adenylate cyclase